MWQSQLPDGATTFGFVCMCVPTSTWPRKSGVASAEEERRRQRFELDLAGLERVEHFILPFVREKRQGLLVLLLAVEVDLAEGCAIDLLRRELQLETLLRPAVLPRALAVVPAVHAPRADELLVDELRDVGFFGTGAKIVRRD
jgi:hypothetical protein